MAARLIYFFNKSSTAVVIPMIAVRMVGSGTGANLLECDLGVVVESKGVGRLAETVVETCLEHCTRASDHFLGWLSNEQNCAGPLILEPLQGARGADER